MLGVPIIVGQLGIIAQQFADTIMVGQYGTQELAAAGFVNNVFNLVVYFILGISEKMLYLCIAFQKCKTKLVRWMNGLVSGLQNQPRRFDSATHL